MLSEGQDIILTGRDIMVGKNPSCTLMVVCPILIHPLHTNDPSGNKNSMIPAAFAIMHVISAWENQIKKPDYTSNEKQD